MNCDDQLRVVKCNDHAHPLALDKPNVAPLPVDLHIDLARIRDHTFRIGNGRSDAPCPILRMPTETHMDPSLWCAKLSPRGP